MFCKKKNRELNRSKSEDVKRQTENWLDKEKDGKEKQIVQLLDIYKSILWLYQQFMVSRFWGTPKKAMDKFETS